MHEMYASKTILTSNLEYVVELANLCVCFILVWAPCDVHS